MGGSCQLKPLGSDHRKHEIIQLSQGLCEGTVKEMEWGDVNGWVGLGGAKLGSKRALPTGKEGLRILL